MIEVRPFLAVSVHLKNETFLVSFWVIHNHSAIYSNDSFVSDLMPLDLCLDFLSSTMSWCPYVNVFCMACDLFAKVWKIQDSPVSWGKMLFFVDFGVRLKVKETICRQLFKSSIQCFLSFMYFDLSKTLFWTILSSLFLSLVWSQLILSPVWTLLLSLVDFWGFLLYFKNYCNLQILFLIDHWFSITNNFFPLITRVVLY